MLNFFLGLHALYFILTFIFFIYYQIRYIKIATVSITLFAKLGFVSLLLLIYRLGG